MLIYEATAADIESVRSQFKKHMADIYERETNPVLDSLSSVDGYTKSAYLSRVSVSTTYTSARRRSTASVIETVVDVLLQDNPDYEGTHNPRKKADLHDKIEGLRTLCQLGNTPDRLHDFVQWMETNGPKLNEALASCLALHPQELAQETCFAIAILARRLHFSMLKGFEILVVSLLRVMALGMVPRELSVEALHAARQRHEEQQLYRRRKQEFHQPPAKYAYSEVFHRLIGIVYFTLADLLYNIPHPEIIHFFETRIIRRREMTRILLFRILDSISTNLSDIREEALRLSSPPETETKGEVVPLPISDSYDVDLWNRLPILLYTDLLRAYNDSNFFNRELISAILNMLRFHAPTKDPIMDDMTLKILENYFAQENAEKAQADKNKKLSINLPPTGQSELKEKNAKISPIIRDSQGSRESATSTLSAEPETARPTLLAPTFNELLQLASPAQPGTAFRPRVPPPPPGKPSILINKIP